MRTKTFLLASLLTIASMVLAACATQPPEQVVETVPVVVTVEVPGPEGETVVVTATPPPPPPAKEFKSADPTTYTEVVFGDPDTLDPAYDYETAGANILQNVYDTLIYFNKEDPNSFVPQLATEVPSLENGGISEDGKVVTFNIRQGVKFHDGSDLTPSDIAYTFQRNILQGGLDSPQLLLTEPILGVGVLDITDLVDPEGNLRDDIEALQAADPELLMQACETLTSKIVADDANWTVTFNLEQSWSPFLPTMSQHGWGAVQSKAWVIAGGGWDGDCATWQNYYGKTSEQLNETPLGVTAMGTGPYIFERWDPGEQIVLKANENYWRTEPIWEGGPSGVPALKTILIKNITEFSTRYAMMQTGDADWINIGSQSDWPQMDEITSQVCELTDENCQPTEHPDEPLELIRGYITANRVDIAMNWAINTDGGNNFIGSGLLDGNGIPADFFNDIHVRRAFAYCFNYDQYLNDVLLGEAVRSVNVMLPGMIGYDESTPYYAYDPAKCEEEFKASELKSADGARLFDTGFRMTFAYNTGNTQRQTIGQILQAELSAINENFIIEVTGLPWPTFLRNSRASKFPVFTQAWLEDIHETHNWVVPYTVGTFGVRQGLPDELKAQFQDIIDRGVVEPDSAKRAEIYKEFNQLFYEQVPTLLGYNAQGRRYHQRWVSGWYYNPVYPGRYYYSLSKE